MEVIELKGSNRASKHDIQLEGETLRFEIEDCGSGGVIARYYKMVPFAEHLKELGVPDVLLEQALNVDRQHKDVHYQKHIHVKWYHKLLGWDLEKLILKYVAECKKEAWELETRRRAVNILKQILEK